MRDQGQSRSRKHVAVAVGASMALAVVVAACSGTERTDASGPATSALTESTPSWSLSTEDSIAMAEDDKHVASSEQYKIGQTLLITSGGPSPSTLVVIRDRELTIKNNTAVPQLLTFINADVDDKGTKTLGPIAPGEQLVYKPPFPISMAYTIDGDGVDGMLQVDTGEFSG